MKAVEWDATNTRYKERYTGRVLADTVVPAGIEDGDLWIDTSAAALLKAARDASTNRFARVALISG